MDNPINFNDPAPVDKSSNLWKNLIYTFLGTTISILLTFGSGSLIQMHHQAQSRRMTAMMVISHIESCAQKLEDLASEMKWRDTIATYMLSIPMDSLDNPENLPIISAMRHPDMISLDKTIETAFSSTIETWKDMDNFGFINSVGRCFSLIKVVEDNYNNYIESYFQPIREVNQHPENYSGNSVYSKYLHNKEYRKILQNIHDRSGYYMYFADKIRVCNSINMKLMDISDKDLEKFLEESDTESFIPADSIKRLKDFITPALDPKSLPDIHSYFQFKQ